VSQFAVKVATFFNILPQAGLSLKSLRAKADAFIASLICFAVKSFGSSFVFVLFSFNDARASLILLVKSSICSSVKFFSVSRIN
jgi:hypothetical protein